jgi:hypothetical protein
MYIIFNKGGLISLTFYVENENIDTNSSFEGNKYI